MIPASFCQNKQKIAAIEVNLFDTQMVLWLRTHKESIMQRFIIGSDVMRFIINLVHQVAKYDVNVLLTGESGTGKEMLAQMIHLESSRAENPFVPVNCGILSGLLFEDKLFGHEKGSFTGAICRQKGCFETADKGTLFLDEVSGVPLENQVDFLRVLEDLRFSRIGGNEQIEADVRIIAATNKDLRDLVKKGEFREDLFYRLHVVPIYIPPLRERKSAIAEMVNYFLDQLSARYEKPRPAVSSEAMDIFCRYDWPGNVRELKNLLERVLILNVEDTIGIEQLPSDFLWHVKEPPAMDLGEVKKKAETKAILDVFDRVQGDRERAAQILNISPRTLRYKLNRYGIKVDSRGNVVS